MRAGRPDVMVQSNVAISFSSSFKVHCRIRCPTAGGYHEILRAESVDFLLVRVAVQGCPRVGECSESEANRRSTSRTSLTLLEKPCEGRRFSLHRIGPEEGRREEEETKKRNHHVCLDVLYVLLPHITMRQGELSTRTAFNQLPECDVEKRQQRNLG
jgi:hypothetical protein